MGCINSSNHRKKYIEHELNNQQQNLPPQNDSLSKRTSIKSRNQSIQLRKYQNQHHSQQFIVPQSEGTQKMPFEVEEKKAHKLSGQRSEQFSNKSTYRQKKGQKQLNDNQITKNGTKKMQQQQRKLSKQEEKILQILKRSEKISKVYRKVCEKMIQYNQQEYLQQAQFVN